MKILVTGGSGVIGKATVTELLRRGHSVRLLSRGAKQAVGDWNGDVEPFAADVGDAATLHGAAEGCHAVIHVTGIVEEDPPQTTFERINVGGTRNIIAEAERAHVQRFVYVSSLGLERGETDYHRSKREAEDIARGFPGGWVIARAAAVMGPGDETVSLLLRMVRTLPAVPIIDSGEQPFQPVWHEDIGWALGECVERPELSRTIVHIAGPDVLTVREVLDLFGRLTDRSPVRLPLPAFLARIGSSLMSAAGLETPVSAATVQMLLEGNYLREGEPNDLTGRLGYRPLPTSNRLVELADAQAEQTPDEGVGKLQHRQFHIDVRAPDSTAAELFARFRDRFHDLVPFEAAAEPGSATRIAEGATLTLELPGRGHVQVRVEQIDERSCTLATLEGHPLAGVVRFSFQDREGGTVRFMIDVIERPASRLDQLSMAVVGSTAQTRTWKKTAENVAALAGGEAVAGVVEESRELDDVEAVPLEDWTRQLVQRRRQRAENRV